MLKQYTVRHFSRKQNKMPPRSSFQNNRMLNMTQISCILEANHNIPSTTGKLQPYFREVDPSKYLKNVKISKRKN